MEENKRTFTFTYSASQQEEVKRIREKYAPPVKEEDKMEQLRRLDKAATIMQKSMATQKSVVRLKF